LSTLTKIFVVLMVVFSIAFTMATIGFVAKTNRWRDLATGYREDAQIVQTHMRNLSAGHAAEKTIWVDAKRSLEGRIAEMHADAERLNNELVEAQEYISQITTEKSNALAHADQLLGQLKVAEAGRQEQTTLRESVEARNHDLEMRNAELNLRVQEYSTQVVVLLQQQRQLEQQLNILREENRKLAGAGGRPSPGPAATTGRSVPSGPPAMVAPIRGEILEVSGNLATISVGSSDGVRDGMVFVIYRGKEYIGDLEVTDIEPNLSAGRLLQTRATPRPADQVADEPALGLAQ
jgi:hypothetical protein